MINSPFFVILFRHLQRSEEFFCPFIHVLLQRPLNGFITLEELDDCESFLFFLFF